MVKCPNCGSTAQVELLWHDNYSRTDYHEYEYCCGCGCTFEVRFEIASIKIIEPATKSETPCSVGGLMVQKMIEAYERSINNEN